MSKTLLITGGASGIGAATAHRAAARGYKVAINYRSRDAQAKAVVADIEAKGGRAVALPGDMAREADIVRLFEETERALGPITHLVNSAGIDGGGMRVDEYDAAVLAQPLRHQRHRADAVLPRSGQAHVDQARRQGRRDRQRLVDGGTIGGRPGSSAYAASKGAVDAFTKGFAREVAAEGIRVNSLRPGMVLTEMTEDAAEGRRLPRRHRSVDSHAAASASRHEIADAILWLLSDEASFITGAMLDAAGGGLVII